MLRRELGDRVAEPALAEGAEEREVLPDLRRRRAAVVGQLVAGGGREAARLELLQVAQVHRETADGRVGDALHGGGKGL